jgi:hypothetical protein
MNRYTLYKISFSSYFVAPSALFVGCMLIALLWPIAAIKELLAGELVANDEEIPISVR